MLAELGRDQLKQVIEDLELDSVDRRSGPKGAKLESPGLNPGYASKNLPS